MSENKEIEIKKPDKSKEKNNRSQEIALRRKNPFSLFQEMDRLFDDLQKNFFDEFYWPFGWRHKRPLSLRLRDHEPFFRTPLANITEDDKFYNITAELPGMNKGDIEITIQDGKIEIKGEVKEDKKEEKEGQLIRREYHSSSYYRAFSLPENVDEDKIEANLDKGILKLKLPKVEPSEPVKKKIEIK